MFVTLETLELTPEELAICKDAVHKMAYLKWVDAGCPDQGQLEFWLQAEREWIEHNYVPHRTLDGSRPRPDGEPWGDSASENPRETADCSVSLT